MVKRFAWKRYAYITFAIMVMLTCWESNRSNAMLYAASTGAVGAGIIPQESIRIRILANSDSPMDQWIKREVRDALVKRMNSWVTEPVTIEEARALVGEHLPEMDKLVGETLRSYGFGYDYKVELGMVPFPVKTFGNEVYPAGDYEALRISLGEAKGENWWCVLFPPLCFSGAKMIVKKNTAYAAAAEDAGEDKTGKNGKAKTDKAGETVKTDKPAGQADASKGKTKEQPAGASEVKSDGVPQPEVRFFLWDLVKKVGSMFA